MKWGLVLVFVMIAAWSVELSYDRAVMVRPGREKVIEMGVAGRGEYRVMCMSDVKVTCPTNIEVGEVEATLEVLVRPEERGDHKLKVYVGDESAEIHLVVTNQTTFFINELERYNDTFSRLTVKYGMDRRLERGLVLVQSGMELYRREDYMAINEVLAELRNVLNDYYSTITPGEPEEERISLGMAWWPLMALGGALTAYYLKKRIKNKSEDKGVQKLLELQLKGDKLG